MVRTANLFHSKECPKYGHSSNKKTKEDYDNNAITTGQRTETI